MKSHTHAQCAVAARTPPTPSADSPRLLGAAKADLMSNLSPFCVYTMRHSAELDAQTKIRGPHVLRERKPWKTGHQLWDQARRAGEVMPIVFSGAEDDTGLIYWATIEEVQIDEANRATTCTYSGLRPIIPARPISSLRLRTGDRPLSEEFIRPYAICRTPAFIA